MTLCLTTTKLNQVAVYFEDIKYKMLLIYIFIAIYTSYIPVNFIQNINLWYFFLIDIIEPCMRIIKYRIIYLSRFMYWTEDRVDEYDRDSS